MSPFDLFHFNVSLFLRVFVTSALFFFLMGLHWAWVSRHKIQILRALGDSRGRREWDLHSGHMPSNLGNQESETRSGFTLFPPWLSDGHTRLAPHKGPFFSSLISFTHGHCSPFLHKYISGITFDVSLKNVALLINARGARVFLRNGKRSTFGWAWNFKS